jgi:hypothetical protein
VTSPAEPTTIQSTTEDTAASAVSQPAARSDPEPGRSWINRLLGRSRDPEPAEVSQEETEKSGEEQKPATPPSTPDDFSRAVQAEVDRRDAIKQREQRNAERARLRREDPFAYAEQDEQTEQQAKAAEAFGSQIATVASSLDRAILDPILERIPEKARAKLFEDPNAGVGIDGRRALTVKAIETIEREAVARGRAEAADKLLDDPIHQKKVLARVRGEDFYEEADLAPGTPATPNSRDVNTILRQTLGYR